jgi:hypothetical protein
MPNDGGLSAQTKCWTFVRSKNFDCHGLTRFKMSGQVFARDVADGVSWQSVQLDEGHHDNIRGSLRVGPQPLFG